MKWKATGWMMLLVLAMASNATAQVEVALLRHKEVRRDLEIVDEQLQLLDDAFADAEPTVKLREAMNQLRELPPDDRRAAFEKLHTTLKADKQRLEIRKGDKSKY